jgi:dimethylamine monooxygenase subunit A
MSKADEFITPGGFDVRHAHVPFAMRPGLQRVEESHLNLTPLEAASELHRSKINAWQSRISPVWAADSWPKADTLNAIEYVASKSINTLGYGQNFIGNMNFEANIRLDVHVPDEAVLAAAQALSLQVQEDFCILDGRAGSRTAGSVPFMCVATPSSWAPEEKVGLSFAAIHAPVADNQLIMAAADHLVKLGTGGQAWQRFVWTLSPTAQHDQHPVRIPRTPWPAAADAQELAGHTWLRWERQQLWPIRNASGAATGLAMFTIRVTTEPLAHAVRTPAIAQTLRDSLLSMSETVLQYKNLTPIRARMLEWLSTRI